MLSRIIITYLTLLTLVFSQFQDVEVTYERNDLIIKDKHLYILESFNEIVSNYFKFNSFSNDYDLINIPIHIHIIYHSIDFVDENIYDGFNCQILLSNNSDQYFITKNLKLPFYKGKDIYYNSMFFDEIASVLDFYAFTFIANELDTYGLYLGDSYYTLALELTKMGKSSENSEQWNKNENLIKDIKKNIYLRNTKFYFFSSIDILDQDEYKFEDLKESNLFLLENLKMLHDKIGNEKLTMKFMDAYNNEIGKLFNLTNNIEAINFLINFDYKNKHVYEQYLNKNE